MRTRPAAPPAAAPAPACAAPERGGFRAALDRAALDRAGRRAGSGPGGEGGPLLLLAASPPSAGGRGLEPVPMARPEPGNSTASGVAAARILERRAGHPALELGADGMRFLVLVGAGPGGVEIQARAGPGRECVARAHLHAVADALRRRSGREVRTAFAATGTGRRPPLAAKAR